MHRQTSKHALTQTDGQAGKQKGKDIDRHPQNPQTEAMPRNSERTEEARRGHVMRAWYQRDPNKNDCHVKFKHHVCDLEYQVSLLSFHISISGCRFQVELSCSGATYVFGFYISDLEVMCSLFSVFHCRCWFQVADIDVLMPMVFPSFTFTFGCELLESMFRIQVFASKHEICC